MGSNASIMWNLLFGAIGVGYFLYGKKQRRPLPFACGLLLMVFPYFVANTTALVIVGAVLSFIPYFLGR
jgi:hypothetical protein